jgi:signal transduction histidine kinase
LSGAAEYSARVPRGSALPVSELSIALTVALVAVGGVGAALLSLPLRSHETALPVFLIGAGVMFGLGLADIARGRELQFARAVIIAGVFWSLSALTASPESFAYSVGHTSQWFVVLAIAYLLLSYPSGRLEGRVERRLFACGVGLVALLFLPTVLVAEFPHPSLWSMCSARCPHNAFSLGNSNPTIVQDVIIPAREVLVVLLFGAISAFVLQRGRRAGALLGQLYAPIAAFAILQTLVFAVYYPLRAVAPHADGLTSLSWIFVLSLPAVAVACGSGRVYRRVRVGNVLERMTASLAGSESARHVRIALAGVLDDPSLQILHSFPGDSHAWVNERGSPADLDRAADVQDVTRVASGNWRIAILHNPSLSEHRALVISAGSYALAALENLSLTDELRHSLEDLADTRAGRLTAEHDARQKIERDLHDGAQQRLVALRLKLGMAASTMEHRDPAGAETLHALESDVDDTIDEVRLLAHGIYPPLLARTGLRDALRAVARVATLPTVVRAENLSRYSPEIETTVYFSCSEALQNATKHAPESTLITVRVWQDHDLHFAVSDDGPGFDAPATLYGTGLRNLGERLAAVGGSMHIHTSPGQGTVVEGSIPLP